MKKRTFGFDTKKIGKIFPNPQKMQKSLAKTFSVSGFNSSLDFAKTFDDNIAQLEA